MRAYKPAPFFLRHLLWELATSGAQGNSVGGRVSQESDGTLPHRLPQPAHPYFSDEFYTAEESDLLSPGQRI